MDTIQNELFQRLLEQQENFFHRLLQHEINKEQHQEKQNDEKTNDNEKREDANIDRERYRILLFKLKFYSKILQIVTW